MVAVDTPRGVLRRRRQRQLAELEETFKAIGGDEPTLDWMRFKDVPKREFLEAAAKRGWHYADQEVSGNNWLLRFTKNPAYRSVSVAADARQRLQADLRAAEPDIDGTCLLDTTQYAEIPRPELLKLARAVGWQQAGAGGDGIVRLAPVASQAMDTPESFLHGPSLAELRQNPQVVHRASILESRMGFHPLSDATANHARQRHNYYIKFIRRNAMLGILYATIAVVGLAVTFGTFAPSDGMNWYVSLGITLIMTALFAVSMIKARLFSHQRRREIGDFLEAYQQLKQVHEGILPSNLNQ